MVVSILTYTHFQYGRSQWIGGLGWGVIEPDSRTNELKVGLGIRYSWAL